MLLPADDEGRSSWMTIYRSVLSEGRSSWTTICLLYLKVDVAERPSVCSICPYSQNKDARSTWKIECYLLLKKSSIQNIELNTIKCSQIKINLNCCLQWLLSNILHKNGKWKCNFAYPNATARLLNDHSHAISGNLSLCPYLQNKDARSSWNEECYLLLKKSSKQKYWAQQH